MTINEPVKRKRGGVNPLMESGPMGGLPGGGRTPKALQLKNYEKVLTAIDNTAEEAVEVLRDGLRHIDVNVRIRCAQIILNKFIPDKKSKEITGKDGGPIELTSTAKREFVLEVVDMLDNEDQEIILERLEKHGTFGLSSNANEQKDPIDGEK